MSILTTSQLTFCDLKDSYNVHVDTECIGVACDNDGLAIDDQTVVINYSGYMGSKPIGLKHEIQMPEDVILISETNSEKNQNGEIENGTIELQISKGSDFGGTLSVIIRLIFTTDDGISFERYIPIVKYMAGTDAISFQIYSSDGYEFNDEINDITLKTLAFCGSTPLENADVKYQWYLHNPSLESEESEWSQLTVKGSDGEEVYASEDSLKVSRSRFIHFPATLMCKMIINDVNEYSAYVSLTDNTPNYTSRIKFFGDSNIFDNADYLVAYMEVYKNNKLIDGLFINKYYYSDENSVTEMDIITDIPLEDINIGSKRYFIYKIASEYKVVLGNCESITEDENGQKVATWKVADNHLRYNYQNNIDGNASNIVVVHKNHVNKTKTITFDAFEGDLLISYADATVFDTSDPIVSDKAPLNPILGQLWLDTSDGQCTLKIYTQSGEWQYFEQQKGNRVFVSSNMPQDYSVGDLWILDMDYEENEKVVYEKGTMLRAIQNIDENGNIVLVWTDAVSNVTNFITNIKECFEHNSNGVFIRQMVTKTDDEGNVTRTAPFFVNINSQEMGFYSVEFDKITGKQVGETKVVHIGNKSATIQNATFEGDNGTTFKNSSTFEDTVKFNKDVCFGNFVWKVRANGNYGLSWRESDR